MWLQPCKMILRILNTEVLLSNLFCSDTRKTTVLRHIRSIKPIWELVTETEHAFGFKRTGTNLENRMRESIELLKQTNKITINDGKIIVNDASKNEPL